MTVTIQIMMPFWGDFDFFTTAVKSVIAQSDPDWQLTIIDDAYPSPEPQAWVLSLNEPRISYIRNSNNLGVSANFQKALDLATESRVTIMGCDDVLLPNYVSHISQLAETYDVDIIQPGVQVVDDAGQIYLPMADRVKNWIRPKVTHATVLSGEPLAKSLARGDWLYFPSISWKTDRVKQFGFRAEYGVVLDLALVFDLLLDGGSMVLDPQVVFEYRRHRSSESSWRASEGSRFEEERAYLNWAEHQFKNKGWKAAARECRLRLTSRMHALSSAPQAAMARDGAAFTSLIRNSLGR